MITTSRRLRMEDGQTMERIRIRSPWRRPGVMLAPLILKVLNVVGERVTFLMIRLKDLLNRISLKTPRVFLLLAFILRGKTSSGKEPYL